MTVLEDNLEDDQENIKNKAHHLEVVQVLNRKKEKAINKENIVLKVRGTVQMIKKKIIDKKVIVKKIIKNKLA